MRVAWMRVLNNFTLIVCLLVSTSCASTPDEKPNVDPLEPFNRKMFRFNRVLDTYLLKPASRLYTTVTPDPLEARVTSFFENIDDINTFVNSFLQGKFRQGFSDTARVVFNSTFGIGGLFDIATDMGFEKHEEDFGQTLAVWGVGQGPYLVLPVFGPNTFRSVPGLAVQAVTNPFFWIDNAPLTISMAALGAVDLRARSEGALQFIDEAAVDPYAFMREAFLQRRAYLIHDGNPPMPDLFDELEEEEFDADLTIEPQQE